MNFKWRPRHLVRLFFLHTRYLHCLIYIEKSKSESVFLVNQIVLYLITHWFTQYRYICYWFVNVLPNPQIQQRSMAERNRMFIKFNFVNVYRFCSKQTRSWFIKPYSKKVRPIVWFFIHKRTPPPLFPTPYCGQPYVTEEIDHFLWVGTIKAQNDLCMNVNIPFVFLHLPTE